MSQIHYLIVDGTNDGQATALWSEDKAELEEYRQKFEAVGVHAEMASGAESAEITAKLTVQMVKDMPSWLMSKIRGRG